MFTVVDTHIDNLNALFQTNAKYDCIPLCMLLYHEYFFFWFPLIYLQWTSLFKSLVFQLISNKRSTWDSKTDSVLTLFQLNTLSGMLSKPDFGRNLFDVILIPFGIHVIVSKGHLLVFHYLSLYPGFLLCMYLKIFVYFSFVYMFSGSCLLPFDLCSCIFHKSTSRIIAENIAIFAFLFYLSWATKAPNIILALYTFLNTFYA